MHDTDLSETIGRLPHSMIFGSAEADQIDQAEVDLGVRFPQSYRDFLLKVGGATIGGDVLGGLPKGRDVEDIRDLTWRQRDLGFLPPGLIVIGDDGTGGMYGLECDAGGSEGPVYWVSPPSGSEGRALDRIASDFGAFLAHLMEEAEG